MRGFRLNLNGLKKLLSILTIFFFVLQIANPILLYPRAANAQMVVSAPNLEGMTLLQKIWTVTKFTLKTTGDIIFKNMLKDYLNKLAYNAAVYVATGEKGQAPLFLTKPGKLLGEIADKAFGDFIDQMARDWTKGSCGYSDVDIIPGTEGKCKTKADCRKYWDESDEEHKDPPQCIKQFSLCEPLDPGFKLKLTLWIKQEAVSGKEMRVEYNNRCPITGIISSAEQSYDNYETFLNELEKKSPRDYLQELAKDFNPDASQYGMFLQAWGSATEYTATKTEMEKFAQQLQGIWKSKTSKITNEVMTPASSIAAGFESVISSSNLPYATQTGTAVADAIGVFFNTLSSKLLKQIYEKGINPKTQKGGGGIALGGIPTGGVSVGIRAAESMFASLKKPDFNVSGTTDILGELATCPSDASINNCVIDDRFRLAIEQKKTVRQAIEEGLIDGTKTFGYDAVTQKDPDYRNGYPLRSLLILRKYRIIPVGWELAAKYIQKYTPANFGLKDIMDKYDDCGRCTNNNQSCRINSDCDGSTCDNTKASPFCGLVDPNWVLKIPEVYCKRQGAGEKIISDEWETQQLKGGQEVTYTKATTEEKGQIERRQIQRMDYCADEQTCIAENEDGSCKKFGYCVEEKPVWKFHGDQCEAYYNSCQTFVRNDGAEVSYLKNTLNYNNCNADNAGCQWYCEEKDASQSRWICEAPALDPNGVVKAVGSRINFNSQAVQCDPKADGCTEFIRTKRGLGTNLIGNGSFEFGDTDSVTVAGGTNAVINYWPALNSAGTDLNVYKTTDTAYFGSTSFNIQATAANQGLYSDDAANSTRSTLPTDFYFQQHKSYTLSAYVKISSGASDAVKVALGSTNCNYWKETTSVLSADWQRLSVTFPATENYTDSAPPCSGHNRLEELRIFTNSAATFYVDGVQLEENSAASEYEDYGSSNKIYLNGQRTSCTANEVGCEKYTPTDGSQAITGIITDPSACNPLDPSSCDQCPLQYVGCKAYREMPITQMPKRQATDPVSFVANSGKTCPASEVGCEEYTNLDEVAKGGEGLEYFGYVRMCILPESAGQATYYTWVGTEEFGYQLRSYKLKQTNLGDGAPCTNIDVDGWPACNDSNNPADDNYIAACTAAEVGTNPDCAEFYDQAGTTRYRLKSRVIYVSENCLPYRNTFTTQDTCTDTNADGTGDTCAFSGASCNNRDGDCRNEACNPATNHCSQTTSIACATSSDCPPKIFHLDPDQGIRCQAQYAGCREYVGSAGNNTYTVLASDFEKGTISPWDTNTNPALNPSNESIKAGGHSMLVASGAAGVSYASTPVDKLVIQNKSYILSFWAKGAGVDTVVSASFVKNPAANWFTTPDNLPFSGSAALKAGEWNKYSLGPLYHDSEVVAGEKLYIFSDSAFYIDNIVLEEVSDDIYLIKNSYTQCSGYENCAVYKDRGKATHYLKSFSKLCKEDKVGCEAVIDTQNSNSPFKETFIGKGPRLRGDVNGDGTLSPADPVYLALYVNASGPAPQPYLEMGDVNNDGKVSNGDVFVLGNIISDINNNKVLPDPLMSNLIVPNDRITYLVNDSKKYCKADEQGCTKLGSPTIDQNNQVTSYSDVYIVNDPDNYQKIICSLMESGCREYKAGEGQSYYFKDPGRLTCTYKRQAGAESAGWYKSGSNSLMPDCPVINVGGAYSIPASGWVGNCPADKSGCSEYRDPHEPTNCNIAIPGQCNSYYYINSTIDTTGCNGVFNPDEGCILFADETQINSDKTIRLTYDSDSTYNNFDAARKNVSPTVCTGGADCDSNTIIKVDRDRTCNKWLECRSSKIEKNQKGENQEFCYAIGVCNELDPDSGNCIGTKECSNNTANHCANATEEEDCKAGGGICRDLDSVKSNLTFNTPSDVDSVRYMSGSVVGGLSWATDKTIAGYYPYAAMEQIGKGGAAVEDLIINGDFGDKDMLTGPEPSINSSSRALPTQWSLRACSNNNTIDCNTTGGQTSCTDGGGTCCGGDNCSLTLREEAKNGQIKSGDQDNLDENNILEVKPGLGSNEGVYYKIEGGIYAVQSYVVSFRMRYKDEPNANDKITVGFAYAEAETPEPRITAFSNFVNGLHPSTEFKQYIFGPLTPTPKSGTTYLRFVQDAGSSGRTFYLDDISLKPVLEANLDPRCLGGDEDGKACINNSDCASPGICYYGTNIARSCRMYPKSDSLYCSYTDDKAVTYRGWYGYCIEKDPINPQYCLNWWPVDVIAGESNVFGAEEQLSYTGRVPLYMCMEVKGNYSPQKVTSYLIGGGQTAKAIYDKYTVQPRVGTNHALCSGVGMRATGYHDNSTSYYMWGDSETGCSHSAFMVSGDDYISNCHEKCESGNCGANYCVGVGEVDLFPVSNIERGIHISEVEKVRLERFASTNEYIGWGPLDLTVRDAYYGNPYIWAKAQGAGHTAFDYGYQTQSSSGSGSAQGFMVVFDQNTGYVSGYAFRFAINLSGQDTIDFKVTYYLKEPCTKIVQVVQAGGVNQNKAWASRLASSSSYLVEAYDPGYVSRGTLYDYNQDYKPFGGAKQPEDLDPVNWDSRSNDLEPGNQPLYAQMPITKTATTTIPEGQVRAGSPYSCVGYSSVKSCGGTMCIGGGNVEGSSCENSYPDCCDTGSRGDGYCTDGTKQGLCVGVNLPTNGQICNTSDMCWYFDARLKLERLFAKPYDSWVWQLNPNGYVLDNNYVQAWIQDYNQMRVCPFNPPPAVFDPIRPTYNPASSPSDYCGVPPKLKNVVVNAGGEACNSSPCTRCIEENEANAQIGFYVSANEEQIPIKTVYIDWNNDGEADQTFWGNFPTGKMTYNYKLSCPGGGTCNFDPRVRVKDNWDWCNANAANGVTTPCGGETQGLDDCREIGNDPCETWFDPGYTFTLNCAS